MAEDGLAIASATAGLVALTFLAIQMVTSGLTIWRCRRRTPVLAEHPPISLVQPLRGVEPFSAATLQACFDLTYPAYEVLFCVADERDPIVPHVEAAIARHPGFDARILFGEDALNGNPKLNNMAKGWRAARHDRVAFIDSNVLLPPDFLHHLVAAWRPDTGVVSAPPHGCCPDGFWSHLECAFLNSHEARWQYTADTGGMGFAQGKTLFLRRSVIGNEGFAALAAEPAEDAATTKLVRALGLRARLAPPSPQPLGRRDALSVWRRQLRWARLRRVTFPLEFTPEIFTGLVVPLLLACCGAAAAGCPVAPLAIGYATLWYAAEIAMIVRCRWPIGAATLPALVLRDLLLPGLWVGAWVGTSFVWHGAELQARPHLMPTSADV